MEAATTNRMNLLLQRNTERINSAVPAAVKQLMVKAAEELNMNESQFIKLCIIEKLDRMEEEKRNSSTSNNE